MSQPEQIHPQPYQMRDEEWTGLLESIRPALRGYIFAILPHPDAVDDVLQETFLFLWERRDDYVPDTNFKAWAFKAGYFKALSHRRELQRNKVMTLSEEILHRIADAAEQRAADGDERLDALRQCLAGLRPRDTQLLQLQYVERRSLADQARALGVPANRLQKTVSRIRIGLRHCISKRLSNQS